MDPLPHGASLPVLQDYVRRLEEERGFTGRSAVAQAGKLDEEIGETLRVVGKLEGQPADPAGRAKDLGGELVDVLLMLVAVVNRYEIDLQQAYRDMVGHLQLHGQPAPPAVPAVLSLNDLQDHVAKWDAECGQVPVDIRGLLLAARGGGLCQAVAVATVVPTAGSTAEVGLKAGEVLKLLASIASHYGIDVEEAFRRKEERNNSRTWR